MKQNSKIDIIISNLKEYIPQIKEQYKIEEIGIFGSYVRGEETENSDLDILVEFSSSIDFGLLGFCQLENKLSDKLGIKVDLVIKDSLKINLKNNILDEVIYL